MTILFTYLGFLGFVACKVSSQSSLPSTQPTFENIKETKADAIQKVEERQLRYDANVELVVKHLDTIKTSFFEIAALYEGYVQRFSNHLVILRIKQTHLDKAINSIAKLGKLKNKEIVGRDVTDEFNDLQIKIENAEKTRKRYVELLDKAQNVNDIIAVERELARINQEIDLLKGKFQLLDNQIQYATITVHLRERVQPGILGYIFIGLYKGVKSLFVWN